MPFYKLATGLWPGTLVMTWSCLLAVPGIFAVRRKRKVLAQLDTLDQLLNEAEENYDLMMRVTVLKDEDGRKA